MLAPDEVEVSGGGLNGTYSTIQFHFHWGNAEHLEGSEHEVDGKRYPMEVKNLTLCAKPHVNTMFCLTLSNQFMMNLTDAYSESEEGSDCAGGHCGFRGNRCPGVFPQCVSQYFSRYIILISADFIWKYPSPCLIS